VSILHCTTEYPAPIDEVNVLAIPVLAESFGLPVGYSDHTAGTAVAVAAVAIGAVIIEKHLTLDRSLPGPDHLASIEPDAFARMVTEIREVGTTILLVEQRAQRTVALANRTHVLVGGQLRMTLGPADADDTEKIIAAYLAS